ncbi:MAG: tetratricopeptide repeat protein [Planctomycetota bacterium]|nr:MAG: tetratricopeptide repeat protein [Planctomycetota bacterium]
MKSPDWQKLVFNKGILREPIPGNDRVVLWLPVRREGGFQYWERIGSVARTTVSTEQGLCATAATAVSARQRVGGLFGGWLGRLRRAPGEQSWMLPSGGSAEQCGERQTDLLLVWAQDESVQVDEERIKSRWPQARKFLPIAANLFLVYGIELPGARNDGGAAYAQGNPREQADRMLADARRTGDRHGEASALTDLGIMSMHEGNEAQAVAFLEEAWALARQLADRSRENDILPNLGMATLAIGQTQRAQQLFEQALAYARNSGDRFSEKAALQGLGLSWAVLGDPAQAITYLEQALALARELNDWQQESTLLWYLGIGHATLGQREQAIFYAQQAVDLMDRLKKPEADLYAEHLRKYKLTGADRLFGSAVLPQEFAFGGSIVTTVTAAQPVPAQNAAGPGILQMAFTAARSMTKFLGSGMKTVTNEARHKRLQTCQTCEHFTGLRCRVCGCFVNVKSRLPHEDCPIGKWPK